MCLATDGSLVDATITNTVIDTNVPVDNGKSALDNRAMCSLNNSVLPILVMAPTACKGNLKVPKDRLDSSKDGA